ncbi:hypothetical protein [Streptomyces californicus]|uniref:hypothetical protein n=1 Tax=Streptomyces californicus TaxID=67351 RepID=UPI0036519421
MKESLLKGINLTCFNQQDDVDINVQITGKAADELELTLKTIVALVNTIDLEEHCGGDKNLLFDGMCTVLRNLIESCERYGCVPETINTSCLTKIKELTETRLTI